MNQTRNVLHVINIYFSLAYFGDQFIYFSGKGYKQYLICSPSDFLNEYSKKQKIEYFEIEITRKISLVKDLKAIYKICKYIRKNNIRIIVGHTPKGALLAMLAGYIMRVPKRIYYRHGLVYETMSGFKRNLMISIDRLTAFCSTKVVVVSTYILERSLTDRLNSANKQLILGKGTCGGIDTQGKFNPNLTDKEKLEQLREEFKIKKNTIVIGYCGRLVKDKGIIELVDSFIKMETEKVRDNFKLLLVGGYEERDVLPEYTIQQIANNPNIICTGFIYNDIEYYYGLMNLFILPSYREGFGMAVLEASSMGVPVLATNNTGCLDSLVEQKTGFYITNTVDGITEGIQKVLSHPNPSELGKNGREFVVFNFDNKVLWPQIETKLYLS
jgi:glycosyltransferase involved in cell wall biosynthesis